MRAVAWLGVLAGCGGLVSEAEFGGRWRIAEHRVEVAGEDPRSAYQAGFFDCNALYVPPPTSSLPATPGVGLSEGCIYFLSKDFSPEERAFYPVIDPEPRPVTLLVDTDLIDEQLADISYGGGTVQFSFTEVKGGLELRAPGVVWGDVTLDVVFVVTKD